MRTRRRILAAFLALAGASAVPAVVAGGAWTEAHLFLDGALLAYVALLLELRRRAAERDTKVRRLPSYPEVSPAPLRAVGERSS